MRWGSSAYVVFHLWYLFSYKWEKYDFYSVCFLGLDQATVKKRIGKNDAITKISAGKDNFCGSNWIKFPSVPSWREKKSEQTWWIPTPWIDLNVSYGQLNSIIYIGHKCQSFWFVTLISSKNALLELKFPIEFTKSKICSIKQKKALILVILQYANDPKMKI